MFLDRDGILQPTPQEATTAQVCTSSTLTNPEGLNWKVIDASSDAGHSFIVQHTPGGLQKPSRVGTRLSATQVAPNCNGP